MQIGPGLACVAVAHDALEEERIADVAVLEIGVGVGAGGGTVVSQMVAALGVVRALVIV